MRLALPCQTMLASLTGQHRCRQDWSAATTRSGAAPVCSLHVVVADRRAHQAARPHQAAYAHASELTTDKLAGTPCAASIHCRSLPAVLAGTAGAGAGVGIGAAAAPRLGCASGAAVDQDHQRCARLHKRVRVRLIRVAHTLAAAADTKPFAAGPGPGGRGRHQTLCRRPRPFRKTHGAAAMHSVSEALIANAAEPLLQAPAFSRECIADAGGRSKHAVHGRCLMATFPQLPRPPPSPPGAAHPKGVHLAVRNEHDVAARQEHARDAHARREQPAAVIPDVQHVPGARRGRVTRAPCSATAACSA